MSKTNIFKTDNLSICAYLELEGLKPAGEEIGIGKNGNYKVYFLFDDPENKGRDLEISFRFSRDKKYRDLTFFYRNRIEKLIDALKEKTKEVITKE